MIDYNAYKLKYSDTSLGNIITVGGKNDNFNGPSKFFVHLSYILQKYNISLLRTKMDEKNGIEILKNGIKWMESLNDKPIILIGWSFGGYVTIRTLYELQCEKYLSNIKEIILLASQSHGTNCIAEITGIPITILHGTEDKNVIKIAAQQIYDTANEPKKIIFLNKTGHNFGEKYRELYEAIINIIDHFFGTSIKCNDFIYNNFINNN